MYTNLSREVLEQIFTQPNITKEDLLQLQLTCKRWSPVAQKHLYEKILLEDDDDQDFMEERYKLLAQTLFLYDKRIRGFIKCINIDSLFALEDPVLKFAALAVLCPNLTTLAGSSMTAEFYQALPNLYRNGNLQNVEYIDSPEYLGKNENEVDALITSYERAIVVFGKKIKEITILGGVGKAATIDNPIQPTYIKHFPRLETLHIEGWSRFHLFRLNEYISSCCSRTTSISIRLDPDKTEAPLLEEYSDEDVITEQEQVQKLWIQTSSIPLTTNEIKYLMRKFPSVEDFTYRYVGWIPEAKVPIQHDMNVVIQFFDYLFQIPRLDYHRMWFGVSEGLDLLPHLANSVDIKELFLSSSFGSDNIGISIALKRSQQTTEINSDDITAASKTEGLSVAVQMITSAVQASFTSALQSIKCGSIESVTIGPLHHWEERQRQNVQQHSIDYIIDHYTSLKDLTFSRVRFPLQAPHCQFERIDHVEYSCIEYGDYGDKDDDDYVHDDPDDDEEDEAEEGESDEGESGEGQDQDEDKAEDVEEQEEEEDRVEECSVSSADKNLQIHLPYTAIDTITLTLRPLLSYTIKIWANFSFITLKASRSGEAGDFTMEECKEAEDSALDYDVTILCTTLKAIRCEDVTFILP